MRRPYKGGKIISSSFENNRNSGLTACKQQPAPPPAPNGGEAERGGYLEAGGEGFSGVEKMP